MSGDARRNRNDLAIWRGGSRTGRDPAREADFQGLWFTLARMPWSSLVLVPADDGESAAGVAVALADVGRRLRGAPVTFLVMAGAVDYASAARFVSAVARGEPEVQPASRAARVVVSVPPVVAHPLALAVTDAADAVALVVRKGVTHRREAARTVDLIGRDRLVGCVLA